MSFQSKLVIDISNIEVSTFYYSFNYVITIKHSSSSRIIKGEYSGDHCWSDDMESWKKCLMQGEAANLVLQQEI